MCSEESSDTLGSRKKTDFYHTPLAELLHNDDQRQDLMVEIIFQKQAKKVLLKAKVSRKPRTPKHLRKSTLCKRAIKLNKEKT